MVYKVEAGHIAMYMYTYCWCLFRLECEELRSTMSKRNTDMVCRERDAQLREKEFIREQEHEGETRVLLLLNASEWVT